VTVPESVWDRFARESLGVCACELDGSGAGCRMIVDRRMKEQGLADTPFSAKAP
jgi:hypothetical protein